MKSQKTGLLYIGLPSWTIQDGNYEDFKKGEQRSFALEFYAPTELVIVEREGASPALEHLRDSTYRIVGNVIHIREMEWWAIDAGVRMYRDGRPPRDFREGDWVSGEVYVGVDPFLYIDRHSRHHTAPGLIYDWNLKKIEMNMTPLVMADAGYRIRDPSRRAWPEIEATNAWSDGGTADYVLHCELLNGPPRR